MPHGGRRLVLIVVALKIIFAQANNALSELERIREENSHLRRRLGIVEAELEFCRRDAYALRRQPSQQLLSGPTASTFTGSTSQSSMLAIGNTTRAIDDNTVCTRCIHALRHGTAWDTHVCMHAHVMHARMHARTQACIMTDPCFGIMTVTYFTDSCYSLAGDEVMMCFFVCRPFQQDQAATHLASSISKRELTPTHTVSMPCLPPSLLPPPSSILPEPK